MIGHRGLQGLSSCVRGAARAALAAAMLGGIVGCAGGVRALDGRYRSAPLAGIDVWSRPVMSAPAPSADVGRSLASADEPGEPGEQGEQGEQAGTRFKNTGWRTGFLRVGRGAADLLEEKAEVGRLLTVWGYQFEWLRGRYGDWNGLVDVVPLVVGLEQSAAIPAVNLVAGLRANWGLEVGGGIHYSYREGGGEGVRLPGAGLLLSLGYAARPGGTGRLVIPVNLGVVLADDSPTWWFTIGWTVPKD